MSQSVATATGGGNVQQGSHRTAQGIPRTGRSGRERARQADNCIRSALGYLGEDGPDGKLLDTIQRNSNEILTLQQQLRELWAPLLAKP
jgi:hypothetical protein